MRMVPGLVTRWGGVVFAGEGRGVGSQQNCAAYGQLVSLASILQDLLGLTAVEHLQEVVVQPLVRGGPRQWWLGGPCGPA
jgi:hypothetical protein